MPWIIGGSMLVGGLLGSRGQSSANKANLQIAREQMAFQERMSNSAYTRATKDLENAGLNRILALGGPSSSPAGASAVMGNKGAAAADAASKLGSTAIQGKLMKQQLKNMEAQEQLTRAQAGAIAPVSKLGDTAGGWLDDLKKFDYEAMKDRAKSDYDMMRDRFYKDAANTARTVKTWAYGENKGPGLRLGTFKLPPGEVAKEAEAYIRQFRKDNGRDPTKAEIIAWYEATTGRKYIRNEIGIQER